MNCFVIMPFAAEFDPVYETVRATVRHAIPQEAVECYSLKHVHSAGRITDDIVKGIDQAVICIADVTGSNPNVMWETGNAMALGRPTILLGQSIDNLPFDLLNHRVLEYHPDQLSQDLGLPLARAVSETLSRYAVKSSARAYSADKTGMVVAVTGSMHANRARVYRRAEVLLAPYLSAENTWYCGSVGDVDETIVGFLLEHNQRTVVVGYNRFDASPYVRELIEAGSIRFIDASVESIRRELGGPSERDNFFVGKADLVVLFWDGQSPGTSELIRFYEKTLVNTLIGFI